MKFLVTVLIFLLEANTAGAQSCPKGDHWVSFHYRNAYYRYDGVFVSSTEVSGHCRENPRGYDKWHSRLSNGRPSIWGYKGEKSKKWKVEEVERVFEALSALPENILNQYVKNIHRMHKSVHEGNSATTNFDEVVLYDAAFAQKQNLARILAHELAHVVYMNFPDSKRTSYEKDSDWINLDVGGGKTITIPRHGRKFVEKDGELSPDEDFANNIEFYLFEPEALKEKSNAVYLWIQKTFGSDFKLVRKK
jgi:hypothetical protein